MFKKILIANRGEIAVRIIRACKEMGIATVAVFSTADATAMHASLADESVCIGGPAAKSSYLNQHAIITAAIEKGAVAIHPGYGLLSENASFARLCEKCGITFIGPSPEIIDKMGDKDVARKTMIQAKVPVVPGCDAVDTAEQAKKEAKKIGYPLLIKARAGGGGKGIRLVEDESQIESAFNNAKAEAEVSFGDGGLYMEKFLSPVKHIEMQVLADVHGNVVVLGERECSVQRRNQKLIEESPSPAVSDALRVKMIESTIQAAKFVKYQNAGTIEYLVDSSGNYYFMEMNTRLQVEHPVSELVSDVDIVKSQIRIAAKIPLEYTQKDVLLIGHAIECRINAENPRENFRPGAGRVTLFHQPGGPWVRFDSAIYHDYLIPPYYDSMIGKLIVYAKTREEAIRKMKAALAELVIEGVDHNADFQAEILNHPVFESGDYYTNFLSKHLGIK
ncbi:MAG: acetyl-CoA carboxylase biotin carboxylase subunit [Firmicutes bacterium]|nr:acetyl-CoA carboxylase biotin carboxylase subunit [Bacillota bacterium]